MGSKTESFNEKLLINSTNAVNILASRYDPRRSEDFERIQRAGVKTVKNVVGIHRPRSILIYTAHFNLSIPKYDDIAEYINIFDRDNKSSDIQDIESLDCEDGQFDSVILMNVLGYVNNHKSVVKEALRVSNDLLPRPEGRGILGVV